MLAIYGFFFSFLVSLSLWIKESYTGKTRSFGSFSFFPDSLLQIKQGWVVLFCVSIRSLCCLYHEEDGKLFLSVEAAYIERTSKETLLFVPCETKNLAFSCCLPETKQIFALI